MTPAETLATARSRIVGPYVPATEALLEGWCGPAEEQYLPRPLEAWTPVALSGRRHGYQYDHLLAHGLGGERAVRAATVHLDLRRPEVRDRLVRCGAPEWARDIPAALWVWAVMGKAPRFVLREWDDAESPRVDRWTLAPVLGVGMCTMSPDAAMDLALWSGWVCRVSGGEASGPETGPEGRACADLAALRAGCVLEEADGWLVPLPDGGIGFWPREAK